MSDSDEHWEPPSKCARLGCSRPRQYPWGCGWDHCCKSCFKSSFDGERSWEHESWCRPVSYVEVAAAERMERRRRLAIQQYFRGGEEERNAAESLRLDLCHGCALEAAGISDDGSSVAANYLQRRRVAFNTSYPGIQDYHLLPWHPGLNELGLTTCSACGPNGKLSTNQRLKQRTEPVPQA